MCSRLGTPVRSTVLSLTCSTPTARHSCYISNREKKTSLVVHWHMWLWLGMSDRAGRDTHLRWIAEIFCLIFFIHSNNSPDFLLLDQLKPDETISIRWALKQYWNLIMWYFIWQILPHLSLTWMEAHQEWQYGPRGYTIAWKWSFPWQHCKRVWDKIKSLLGNSTSFLM